MKTRMIVVVLTARSASSIVSVSLAQSPATRARGQAARS